MFAISTKATPPLPWWLVQWTTRENEGVPFDTALWTTRAGNVFTTHTPVAAAFDQFEPALVARYAAPLAADAGIEMDELLALGRDGQGAFNMAFLAMRGCAR